MSWVNIGSIIAQNQEWQLSQPFDGNLIKVVSDVTSPNFTTFNKRGLIAFNYGLEDFLKIKVFYSTPRSQLFLFPNLDINKTKYLAIRDISKRITNNQWEINCYVWNLIV